MHKASSLCALLGCLLLFTTQAWAAPLSGHWCGRVFDAVTGEPIEGVTIEGFGIGRSPNDAATRVEVFSDARGRYCLRMNGIEHIAYNAWGYVPFVDSRPEDRQIITGDCNRDLREVYLVPLPLP